MTIKITSPVEGLTLETYLGPLKLEFKDGVAEVDDLNDGQRAYLYGAGYEIDGESIEQPKADEPVDSRDASNIQTVGTPLRDAAVDPRPEDFLAPTNAGEADPHGPEVVSPEVHASPTGPIVPGVVGEPDYQDAKESAVAEAVRGSEQIPVPEVMTALEEVVDRENAGDVDSDKVDDELDEGLSDEKTEPAPVEPEKPAAKKAPAKKTAAKKA